MNKLYVFDWDDTLFPTSKTTGFDHEVSDAIFKDLVRIMPNNFFRQL
jgi:hypothetical protein